MRAAKAYAVHLLTASGVAFLLFAVVELCAAAPRPWFVFLMFAGATLVDALDGPLARAWHVKAFAPDVDGRTVDDLVDYLGFVFVPLLLVWRMGWLPGGATMAAAAWVVPALVASLLGFAHVMAKDEAGGFFRGFPSYWNLAAWYAGAFAWLMPTWGPWMNAAALLALAGLTVAPVWFVYPNLAPRKWRPLVLGGAAAWAALVLATLPWYPRVPAWAVALSLVYPAFYVGLSLALRDRWPGVRDRPV